MLQSIRIKGLRRYKDLSINGLSKVNFILGANNIGKTTILEGIYSWACGKNIIPMLNIPMARARYSALQHPYWVMEELLAMINDRHSLPLKMSFEGMDDGKNILFEHSIYPSDLLTDYDSTYKTIEEGIVSRTNEHSELQQVFNVGLVPGIISGSTIIAKWDIFDGNEKKDYDLTIPFINTKTVKPYCTAKYIDILNQTVIKETAQIYGALKREGIIDEVTKEIRKIFPDIQGFDMLPYPDGSQSPVSVVKKDGSFLPMYAYGDGVQRWFFILGAIALYKKTIICIDEIDSGIHPEAQRTFCENMIKYAIKNGVQLFITTHNMEFLDNFLDSTDALEFEERKNIRIITLREGEEGTVNSRVLDSIEAHKARIDFGLELR